MEYYLEYCFKWNSIILNGTLFVLNGILLKKKKNAILTRATI